MEGEKGTPSGMGHKGASNTWVKFYQAKVVRRQVLVLLRYYKVHVDIMWPVACMICFIILESANILKNCFAWDCPRLTWIQMLGRYSDAVTLGK